MKRILLALCASLLSLAGWSQNLNVVNQTPCSILVVAFASDFNGASACNIPYHTNPILVPPGGVYTVTVADLTTPPATAPFSWSYARYYDQSSPSCPSGSGSGPCWYAFRDVGDPACGIAPQSTCMVNPTCSPCAGMITNADWHPLSPIDADLIFHP